MPHSVAATARVAKITTMTDRNGSASEMRWSAASGATVRKPGHGRQSTQGPIHMGPEPLALPGLLDYPAQSRGLKGGDDSAMRAVGDWSMSWVKHELKEVGLVTL